MSDAEWEFMLPYLTLLREDAPQRRHPLRESFNALRYVVKTGCPWRFMPHEFPPWEAVYQQARRWLRAGVFEQAAQNLRAVARFLADRGPEPSAAILDSRTLQSTPESGGRLGFDGAKKKKPRGRRHAGEPDGVEGDAGRRTGPGPGRRPGQGGPRGHRRDGGGCLR